jgi:coatomer subunit beta'
LDVLCSTGRVPEAALFARSYAPSKVPAIISKWKSDLGKVWLRWSCGDHVVAMGCACVRACSVCVMVAQVNGKAAEALADPSVYDNLFPEFKSGMAAEAFLR